MKVHELAELLVAIPSVSGDEARIAAGLSVCLLGRGCNVRRAGNNLWFEVGAGRPRLLLNSHIDTVPAASGWRRDPFTPAWEEGRLYGLGANDAKGCVAALVAAAMSLRPGTFDGTAVFAFTAEEETGGAGLATILDEIGPLDAAVVGEPTGLAACTAQRGMLLLRCTARGRPGHAAHADGAENAIHAAARDIARLSELEFGGSAHGPVRAQVTQVAGGMRRNQIPDSCEFFVDIRTAPGSDHERLVAELRGRLEADVAVHSARYLPKATADDAAVVRAALAAGAGAPVFSSTTSDWAFLGDLPAVKIGPGDTRRSHAADEYVTRSELEAGARLYAGLIARFFAERTDG